MQWEIRCQTSRIIHLLFNIKKKKHVVGVVGGYIGPVSKKKVLIYALGDVFHQKGTSHQYPVENAFCAVFTIPKEMFYRLVYCFPKYT